MAGTQLLFQASDKQEVTEAVTRVYCPHELDLPVTYRGLSTTLGIVRRTVQPVVLLEYSTPVKVDAGNFPNLLLMQSCMGGGGTVTQGTASATTQPNETLPLSPGISTRLRLNEHYAQRTVRLDIQRIEKLCSDSINAPLDRPLRFALTPFSPKLEHAWQQAIDLMLSYERMSVALPNAAVISFDDFLLSLVLHEHPHNYSDDLRRPAGPTASRMVREAEQWMRSGGADITVSRIAATMGVSVRTLQAAFREYRRATPTQWLRRIRLESARKLLLAPSEATTVTSAALDNGFFHVARFSGHYQAMFGEPPGLTLRRSRLKGR